MVMLLCLVLVPLAAIFGSGLPKVLNSLVQGAGLPRFRAAGNETDEVAAPAAAMHRSSQPRPPVGLPPIRLRRRGILIAPDRSGRHWL